MNEYDLDGELRRAWAADSECLPDDVDLSAIPHVVSAMQNAYAAGQSDASSVDLQHLVTLAAGHADWGNGTPSRIAAECVSMLSALKAQAVAK